MAKSVRVFICYKKLLSRQEGGQTILQENTKADILCYLLDQHPTYEPWVDNAEIEAGMKWEAEIYRQLLVSDVVLLLIGPGTSKSEWVRREIALANALGISIVPVGFDLTDQEMVEETRALSLDSVQWTLSRNIRHNRASALLAELDDPLMRAYAATLERQRDTLDDLWKRRSPRKTKAHDNQRAASFQVGPAQGRMGLHIASGDVSKVRNVDVLVNSENDYMQMARFFESHTMSSILRRRGACVTSGRYQDIIQQELDWQLRERGRPVQVAEVFATSAGGPDSELARVNKARVIFHVAAVQAVDAESRVVPYKHPQQIEACVRAVLLTMARINQMSGVFSPPGSDQRVEQERLAATDDGLVRSVIFPLFGTGQGGASVAEVVGPMVDGVVDFFADQDNRPLAEALEDIYFSAFAQEDVDEAVKALSAKLMRVDSPSRETRETEK
jgi:O-acetyl-ADP-ribose deacetylase (regulator of RNase III)